MNPRFVLGLKTYGGRIFSNVHLRWVPTGKLFNSCTGKVDSEPTHGSIVDIPHIHACKQTLGLSAGTSFNGQKQQRIQLNADALYNEKQENLRVCHKVVRLGINPMIQPEPRDLPKDNPKLEIAVLRWFEEVEESFFLNVSEDKETTRQELWIVMLKMVPETPLQFGVAERLSRTFRAESTGIRAEAPKMLWADSVSTTYLIYRIPYVPIGLRIPEEEWRGKDTSLTHLKVFGCDSFVKVKDVCGEAMKCTFIGSGSDEMRYSFRDTKSHQVIRSRDITFVDSIYGARSATDSSSLTKPIQKSQVVLVDIPENLAENDSIVAEHGLSSEITQSPGGSSDTSEGSENSGSFEDSGRSDEEYSEDGASSKEGGSETPQVRRSTRESRAPVRYSPSANYLLLTENGEPESYSEALSSKESVQWKKAIIEEMVSLEKNQTCSLVRISAGKKASQRLWMFKVKEEQNGRKRYKARLVVKGFQQKRGEPSYVGALNDTSTQHKSEGFQLAGQEENLECRLKEIMYGLIQAPRLRYLKFDSFMQKDKIKDIYSEKQVLGYVLTVGVTTLEWDSRLQKSITMVLGFVEDSWNEEPCSDVHQVGDEIEVEVLRSFNWPPSELITKDGFLLVR
ncbi:retrovirus-related pol polyprotein from transposon TNT 1-94, partial [Tanacetum coccineum]